MLTRFFTSLLVVTVALSNFKGVQGQTKKLGLLEIFNHFIKVSDILNSVPTILKPIAEDIVNDVKELIPEVEALASKYNVTDPLLSKVSNALDMNKVIDETVPELGEALKNDNITETIREIMSYLDFENLRENILPEVQALIDENNITEEFEKIKATLNVTVIADELLPEIEEALRDENITKMAAEIEDIIDMADIAGKLVPSLERILESNNVSSIVQEIDHLLNLSKLAIEVLTPMQEVIDDLEINETINEIRKLLNISHISVLLDELDKMLIDMNITQDVPELAPFLDINILRSKLTEVDKILVHYDIAGLLDEIEKHIDVDYLIKKVPDLDEFLESLGFSSLLRDIKSLLETSMLGDTVKDVKSFFLSAQIEDKIHDMELLLNTSYLRRVLVPELERMVKVSNISRLTDQAGNFLNMTYVADTIVVELEKMWVSYSLDEQVEMMLNLTTNMEFLKEFIRQMDKEYGLSEKGKKISDGKLADVVNEILTNIFAERVEKDYEMSFVLSGTDWKDSYNDLSNPESEELKEKVLTALQGVYLLDPSMKGAKVVGLKKVNGKVKVITVMTFDDTNDDPGAALIESVADGKLGALSVDPDSVGVKELSTEEEEEDDTAIIVGAVIGSLVGLGLIGGAAAYVVQKNKKKRKVQSSARSIVSQDNGGLTPV